MKVETALRRIKQHCMMFRKTNCKRCCFKEMCDLLNFNMLQITNDMLRLKRVNDEFKTQLKIHEELKNDQLREN